MSQLLDQQTVDPESLRGSHSPVCENKYVNGRDDSQEQITGLKYTTNDSILFYCFDCTLIGTSYSSLPKKCCIDIQKRYPVMQPKQAVNQYPPNLVNLHIRVQAAKRCLSFMKSPMTNWSVRFVVKRDMSSTVSQIKLLLCHQLPSWRSCGANIVRVGGKF